MEIAMTDYITEKPECKRWYHLQRMERDIIQNLRTLAASPLNTKAGQLLASNILNERRPGAPSRMSNKE